MLSPATLLCLQLRPSYPWRSAAAAWQVLVSCLVESGKGHLTAACPPYWGKIMCVQRNNSASITYCANAA